MESLLALDAKQRIAPSTVVTVNSDVRKNTYFRLLILQWPKIDFVNNVSLQTLNFWQQQDRRTQINLWSALRQAISFFLLLFQLWNEWACWEDADAAACSGTGLQCRWEWPEAICMISAYISYPGRWRKVSFHVTVMRSVGMQGVC